MIGSHACASLALLVAALAAHHDAVHGKTLETGLHTTFVLGEGGALYAWGLSSDMLGAEDDPVNGTGAGNTPDEMAGGLPRLESKLANITAVSRGKTCLVDATAPPSRAVQCWGECLFGSCGHGRPGDYHIGIADAPLTDLGSDATNRVISAQGSYLSHMCALFSNGRVKCWGPNGFGQLGLGDTEDRGDKPGGMGDKLPFVDLGTGVNAVQLAVGLSSTCVVLEGRRRIKCWGKNGFIGLGAPPWGSHLKLIGDEPGEMGDNLAAIDMGAEIEDIGMGEDFTCVLLAETREVKCWGRNTLGRLGAAHEDDVRLANATLPAVSVGGRVARLSVGQLSHVCVILENSAAQVKCWGYNRYGQLGLGPGIDLYNTGGKLPSELPGVSYGVPGETAAEISAGSYHTCVRLANGLVRCWGDNYGGDLARGAGYDAWGKKPNRISAKIDTSPCQPTHRPTPSPTPLSSPDGTQLRVPGARFIGLPVMEQL